MTEGQMVALICLAGFGHVVLAWCLTAAMDNPSNNERLLAYFQGMTLSGLAVWLGWTLFKATKK